MEQNSTGGPPALCPHCGSSNLGLGWQLGAGRLYADEYAYHSGQYASPVETVLCKACGAILYQRVTRTDVFRQYGAARRDALQQALEEHGILLCNESRNLPSLAGLGFDAESSAGLIDLHRTFYCKAFKKRSTFLSPRAYYLLKRCRGQKSMDEDAEKLYDALRKARPAEKPQLAEALPGLDKKRLDKALDFLLENLYITAWSTRFLNPNWYTYLYCAAPAWEQQVPGLHFAGDAAAELRRVMVPPMAEKDFAALVR